MRRAIFISLVAADILSNPISATFEKLLPETLKVPPMLTFPVVVIESI